MEGILLFLEKYSNVPIAISAILTTTVTFLIWRVSSKQTEYTYLMGKAAEQPIIQINRMIDTIHNYMLKKGKTVYALNDKILVIEINNIGRGAAYNLEIEQHGRETEKIDILPVGQKHEYIVLGEKIKSNNTSPTVKVTYQDIFENEFTVVTD